MVQRPGSMRSIGPVSVPTRVVYDYSTMAGADHISGAQGNEINSEPKKARSFDIDEDEAIRKVDEANMPSVDAQQGIQHVEAVTLTWTKTSLACAFVW